MKNQFWAVGCELGWTVRKKGLGQLLATFEARFHGTKINLIFFRKYCRVCNEKLDRTKVNNGQKKLGNIFYRGKAFFRSKNLSVSTKIL
jgi:hypothetical protein